MKDKYLSLPIDRFEIDDNDESLSRVKIYLLHSGKNLKKSNFSKATIDDAKDSLKNKPLIGFIEKDKYGNKDFKGHEIEYKIIKKDGKVDIETIYIEQPLGLIPESNDYHYEEIDGQEWAVIDAYIWKEYCKEAYDILKESEKSVSMEIKIIESHNDDDGEYWIDKFKYLGITILGDSHNPAMGSDATISLYEISESEEFVSRFEIISDEINKVIKIKHESEVEQMAKQNKDNFSMSVNQKEDYIRKELEKRKYTGKNYWDELVERQEFYYYDLLHEESICIVSDNKTWGIYYGVPYSFSGDVVTLNYDKMTRYVRGDWRVLEDGQVDNTPEVFEIIKNEYEKELENFETKIAEKVNSEFDVKSSEEYKTLESNYNELNSKFTAENKEGDDDVDKQEFETVKTELEEIKTKYSTLESETERLRKFEAEKLVEQRKTEEEALFEQYSELKEVEGFEELKNEASKYSIEELDTKLAVLFRNAYKNKQFSTEENEQKPNGTVKVPVETKKETEYKPYGGLFERYSEEK